VSAYTHLCSGMSERLFQMASAPECPDTARARLLDRAARYATAARNNGVMLEELLRNGGALRIESTLNAEAHQHFNETVTNAGTVVVTKDPTSIHVDIRGELLAVPSALRNLPDAVENVTLRFDSDGGSTVAAFEIAKLLEGRRVVGHVENHCLSAALLLLQACEHRTASPDAVLMIHSVSTTVVGGVEELEASLETLRQFNADSFDLLVARTGAPREIINEFFDGASHYFTAERARELGLIDEVV
jgi:ATP-dependent protease ClpP protease subunit